MSRPFRPGCAGDAIKRISATEGQWSGLLFATLKKGRREGDRSATGTSVALTRPLRKAIPSAGPKALPLIEFLGVIRTR